MPRKTRRDQAPASRRRGGSSQPAEIGEIRDRVMGGGWKRVAGYEVKRSVREDRRYVCPYCNGPILPGLVHVVAYPEGRLEERRHFHTPCWDRHIKSSK